MKLRTLLIIVVLAVGLPWPAAAVTREELVCPVREDWEEGSEECPCEKGWKPTEEQLRYTFVFQTSEISKAFLDAETRKGDNSDPHRVVLCNANLQQADLRFAQLQKANLQGANLHEANLRLAFLQKANLQGANLQEANLRHAILHEANLDGAKLRNADLQFAQLQRAHIRGEADVEGAKLAFSSLAGTIYAPVSKPPDGYVEGIEGLATVVIPYERERRTVARSRVIRVEVVAGLTQLQVSAMTQLRNLLIDAGLREREREATFAIEHHKALHAREEGSAFERFGGWLQLIFFEWTTGWGLYPARAMAIMLALMGGFGFVYAVAIWDPPSGWSRFGEVVRILPAERLVDREGVRQLAGSVTAEPVAVPGLAAALVWGLYFSMLSAFHIGWRDLNVGSWLTRIQPSEFALRGRGWVRVVSGVQSLISVYLVAMWVLTYFGRPFQ